MSVLENATRVRLTVNGRAVDKAVEPRTHLADFLREELDLTGTHLGCEHGVCGACTILLDGEPARGCITYAAMCGEAEVITIEGLDDDPITRDLRTAFNREHALQCGFCTPGMLIAARDLVIRLPDADAFQIRVALAGNLCRCTGYAGIVTAIQSVMAARRRLGSPPRAPIRRLGPVGAHLGTRVGPQPTVHRKAPAQRPSAMPTAAVSAPIDAFTPAHSFEQRFAVGFPPDRVYAVFGDVITVARCLPGAFVDAQPNPYTVEGGIKVKLGPIAAAFRGAARIERKDAARRGRILGSGADGRSGAQGEIRYLVSDGDAPSTSNVSLSVGYTLRGPLAQFGRPGLVRDIATRLAEAFAANLESHLRGDDATSVRPQTAINPVALVAGVAWGWISARLRRWRSGGRVP